MKNKEITPKVNTVSQEILILKDEIALNKTFIAAITAENEGLFKTNVRLSNEISAIKKQSKELEQQNKQLEQSVEDYKTWYKELGLKMRKYEFETSLNKDMGEKPSTKSLVTKTTSKGAKNKKQTRNNKQK